MLSVERCQAPVQSWHGFLLLSTNEKSDLWEALICDHPQEVWEAVSFQALYKMEGIAGSEQKVSFCQPAT